MSRIKEMTRDVVREGEDRRATFTAQGVPLRIYTWWHRHTKRQVTKENFCHYCRVVAIWAPLMFIRMMLAKLFSDRQFWICMSLAVAAILIGTSVAYPGGVGVVVLGIVAFFAAIVGLLAGYALADYVKDKSAFDDVPKIVKVISIPLMVLTLPVVVVGFMIGVITNALTSKPAKRFYRLMGEARLMKGRVSPFGVLLLLATGLVVVSSVVGGWWIAPLSVLALIAVVFVGRWSAEKLGYYLVGRRNDRRISTERVARQRSLIALEPVLRMIFDNLYLGTQDEERYENWRREYVAHAEQERNEFVWSDIYRSATPYSFPDWMEWSAPLFRMVNEELDRLHADMWQSKRDAEQKREQLVKKATTPFTAIGDFVILLAQFIRVSKWKICPVVELPKDL